MLVNIAINCKLFEKSSYRASRRIGVVKDIVFSASGIKDLVMWYNVL
jgi:hypothetical protein